MDMFKGWRKGDCQKSNEMAAIREKETRQTQNNLGRGD
jgi:hypothetical protein